MVILLVIKVFKCLIITSKVSNIYINIDILIHHQSTDSLGPYMESNKCEGVANTPNDFLLFLKPETGRAQKSRAEVSVVVKMKYSNDLNVFRDRVLTTADYLLRRKYHKLLQSDSS